MYRGAPSLCAFQWPPWGHHRWLSRYLSILFLILSVYVNSQSQAPQCDWNLLRSGEVETETGSELILLLSKHHSQHVPVKTILGNYHSHIDSVKIHNSAPQNKNTQLNSIINPHCGSLWIVSYKLSVEYSSPAVPRMLIFMAPSLEQPFHC